MNLNNKQAFLSFLVLLIMLTIVMIFSYQPENIFYHGDDAFFHYRRFSAIIDAIDHGTFPIYLDYEAAAGYGYATPWFYPDLIIFPFALISKYIGIPAGFKIMWFVMTILCGIFMHQFIKKIFKNNFTATVAALIYTFSAYRLLDIYDRGALGEAISFTFIPLILNGLYEIIKGDYKKWYIISIGYVLLIYTHVLSSIITTLLVTVLIIIYHKNFIKEPIRILFLIIAALVTIPLTAYYLFPMLEMMKTNEYYYSLMSVLSKPYMNKTSIPDILFGMINGFIPMQYEFKPSIGIMFTIIISTRFFIKNTHTQALKFADNCTIIGFFFILLTSTLIPWARFPFNLLDIIQFPWRLLQISTVVFSISGAYYISLLIRKKKHKIIFINILSLIILIFLHINSYNYKTSARTSHNKFRQTDINGIKENNYHLGNLEYVPLKFPKYNTIDFPNTEYIETRKGIIKKKNEETEISDFELKNGITTLDIKINKADTIELPMFYYVGYKIRLNSQEIKYLQSEEGLMEIPIRESGKLSIWYEGTILQKISPYISTILILGIIGHCIAVNRKRKHLNKKE